MRARTFERELELERDADVHGVERDGDAVQRALSRGPTARSARQSVDYVLAATGRTPNVRGLGLENTSLALDARGVPVFDRDTMQCGTSPIFIAGDAGDDLPLLHEAADEGRIAGENAARFPDVRHAPPAHAARHRLLRSAARRRRRALRRPRARHLRHRRGLVRGPGTKPRDAAQ